MPLPNQLAQFNRRVTNRVALTVAGRLPPLVVVEHTGRRSGRTYETPVVTFSMPDGVVIALTYGPKTDWVRNITAAGDTWIRDRGDRRRLVGPRIIHGAELPRPLPLPVRLVLNLLRVDDYLSLTHETAFSQPSDDDPDDSSAG